MSEESKVSPKSHTLMQLEEVNRATSPEEYLAKLNRWATDRGFPPAEEPFNFVLVMQYCERLEAVWQSFAEMTVELEKLRDASAQRVRELERLEVQVRELLPLSAGGWLAKLVRWWSPGRPSGQPGGAD